MSKIDLDFTPEPIAYSELDDDQLVDAKVVSVWLGVSTKNLEVRRSKGLPPAFIRLSARRVLYRCGTVRQFIREHARSQIEPELRRPKPPASRYPPRRRLSEQTRRRLNGNDEDSE